MELYERTSYDLSRALTLRYSTSFGTSARLFSANTRRHIFAIYGLVRIADEIVDTYQGGGQKKLLKELETDVLRTLVSGYHPNPIVHAFCRTARTYGISEELIAPFFASMRMDLTPQTYTRSLYDTYIYGSAEVIGLMCLRVFTKNDDREYARLAKNAQALGAAYQKVNFLRDIASDYTERGRVYFPDVSFDTFSDKDKARIVNDITKDLRLARSALGKLPKDVRRAVGLSLRYYERLLKKLARTPARTLTQSRVRVPGIIKTWLLIVVLVKGE